MNLPEVLKDPQINDRDKLKYAIYLINRILDGNIEDVEVGSSIKCDEFGRRITVFVELDCRNLKGGL